MFFGIVGWIMKRLGWPRPPMVLGLVIGGIFERYLFISTSALRLGLAGAAGGDGDPGLVAWALYRPLSRDRRNVVARIARRSARHRVRLRRSAAFTLAIIAVHRRGDHARRTTGRSRQAGAAHRLLHGADRRHAQPGQRAVRPASKAAAACRRRRRSAACTVQPAATELRRDARAVRRRRDLYFVWLAAFIGAGRADRLHPGDRGVRVRLYVVRLRRAVALTRSAYAAGDDAAVLGAVPLAARRSPGRNRCSAIFSGVCWRRCDSVPDS